MSVDVLCHRFPSKTQPSFRSLLVFRTRLTSQAQSRQFHKLTHLFSYDCWGMFAIANVACVSVSWHSHFPPLSSLPGLQLVCQREKATEEHGAAAGPELGAQNQTLQQVCSGQRRKAQHQQRRQLLRRYGGDSPPSLYTAGSTRVKLQMWETHNPPASQLCDQNRRVPSSSRPRCLCVWFIGFFFFFHWSIWPMQLYVIVMIIIHDVRAKSHGCKAITMWKVKPGCGSPTKCHSVSPSSTV